MRHNKMMVNLLDVGSPNAGNTAPDANAAGNIPAAPPRDAFIWEPFRVGAPPPHGACPPICGNKPPGACAFGHAAFDKPPGPLSCEVEAGREFPVTRELDGDFCDAVLRPVLMEPPSPMSGKGAFVSGTGISSRMASVVDGVPATFGVQALAFGSEFGPFEGFSKAAKGSSGAWGGALEFSPVETEF